MQLTHHPLDFYTRLIEDGNHFAFSRWGDGEWSCILGDEGENCDRHQYFSDLKWDLRQVLRNNRAYYKGWLPVSKNAGSQRIFDYMQRHRWEIDWVDGDVFLAASCHGAFNPFLRALRKRRVLYVGGPHLASLANVVGWKNAGFVQVPAVNAYLEKKEIRAEIAEIVRTSRVEVIGFSAGMLTKVLIDDLWLIGRDRFTMIDFGSLFDIYCGVRSRTHNKRGDWTRLLERNLAGR